MTFFCYQETPWPPPSASAAQADGTAASDGGRDEGASQAQEIPRLVMAYLVMSYIAMADIVMAYTNMADMDMAYIAMAQRR